MRWGQYRRGPPERSRPPDGAFAVPALTAAAYGHNVARKEAQHSSPLEIRMSANRIVAFLTPLVFAPAAGAVAAWLARHFPGVKVSQDDIQQVFIAGALFALVPALQWLHGWQKWEARNDETERAVELANVAAMSPAVTSIQAGGAQVALMPGDDGSDDAGDASQQLAGDELDASDEEDDELDPLLDDALGDQQAPIGGR
jgi:hypothetical protein